ncbi:hypothetical protein UlMin_000890 [Ulmus minor]
MGTWKPTFYTNGSAPSAPNTIASSLSIRNLGKRQLGGVIFGCKNNTLKECLSKQLFGLPSHHFSYVKNIDPGLPLFLFNYSDRKLHGIFEAACSGQMNIDPYGWTADGAERTQYPAQVQVRVRLQCQPLHETQFKSIIADNYYNPHHFWFELDHAQANKLMSLLASVVVAPGKYVPQNTMKWRTISQAIPSRKTKDEVEEFAPPAFEAGLSNHSSQKSDSTDLDGELEAQLDVKVCQQSEKDLIYMKLKELALKQDSSSQSQNLSMSGDSKDTAVTNDTNFHDGDYPKEPMMVDVEDAAVVNEISSEDKSCKGEPLGLEENCQQTSALSSKYESLITQLLREVEELKIFKTEQTQKMSLLEQKLVQAELEIQQLKGSSKLEYDSNPSMVLDNGKVIESFDELRLDWSESIFLLGGYDGESWLSALDSYYPSHDVITSLRPMNCVRSYASVAQLNGELYVIGGGNGEDWYDTVESYSPTKDKWKLCPSLSQRKGSLAAASTNNEIYAIGGGNGVDSFSEVEMLDLDVGRWIHTRAMLQKRFALAAAELNGVLYATGGFDGNDYLKSAERFDPREHSWTKISSMNTKRGCHSLVVLNEKLYAIGGYDGSSMVPTLEIFDPRLGSWITGESMNFYRGYSVAAVVDQSIYVIGGVKDGYNIVDIVERYKEGQGWEKTSSKAVGKRCFLSAIALSR